MQESMILNLLRKEQGYIMQIIIILKSVTYKRL